MGKNKDIIKLTRVHVITPEDFTAWDLDSIEINMEENPIIQSGLKQESEKQKKTNEIVFDMGHSKANGRPWLHITSRTPLTDIVLTEKIPETRESKWRTLSDV